MENTTVTVNRPIVGSMNMVKKCGILTPETKTQAGFQSDSQESIVKRLFFGDHTDSESMKLVEGLLVPDYPFFSKDDLKVKVSGYHRFRKNDNVSYLDTRVLFVTTVSRV